MPTCVGTIMIWSREIEMIVIGIRDVNTEVPTVSTGIDGAVEILCLHKASILPAAKHPAEIVISYIQIIIITIERPLIAIQYIIHQIAYAGNEIIIDFIHIIVLLGVQIQLISHFIGEETGFLTYFAITHSVRACTANSSTQSGKQDK